MDEHLAKIPETALKGCTPANVKALVLSELAKIKFCALDFRVDASSPSDDLRPRSRAPRRLGTRKTPGSVFRSRTGCCLP